MCLTRNLRLLFACFLLFAAGTIRADTPSLFGRTGPNSGLFPDSSIFDFRKLLDGPAGKHGFLKTNAAGHFVWPNGKRAKFWGLNISNKSIFVGKADKYIVQLVML